MNESYLMNFDTSTSGLYRAILTYDGVDAKVYIPTLANPDQADSKAAMFNAIFSSVEMKKTALIGQTPCWITFENGNSRRVIIVGYFGNGIRSIGGSTDSGESNDTGDFDNPNNFTPGDISGTTKNIVFKGHGSLTPTYLILHTIAGPSESASAIINVLQDKNLGIHGIISNSGVIQTAEWNTKQWHAGGNANSVAIGLEMLECENIKWNQTTWIPSWSDDTRVKNYHDAVYNNAVNVYAALANMFNIPTENILSHKEAHSKLGATNHGDPESLWNEFNKKWKDGKWTMSGFRENVDKVRKMLQ